MGFSSSKNMSTDDDLNSTMEGSVKGLKAYQSLKSYSIEKKESPINNIFLITTNSIQNFINIIKQPEFLNDLENENESVDDELLLNKLKNYEGDKKIKLLSNFVDCWRLAEQDIEKENEFIIVNKDFIDSMGINMKNPEKMEVTIEFDKLDDVPRNIVKFRTSKKILTFIKKQSKFYKFVPNIENKSLMCDSSSSESKHNDKVQKPQKLNSINNTDIEEILLNINSINNKISKTFNENKKKNTTKKKKNQKKKLRQHNNFCEKKKNDEKNKNLENKKKIMTPYKSYNTAIQLTLKDKKYDKPPWIIG